MLEFAQVLIAALLATGGWAVVTVKDVPEYFVAGQQYTIEFQVRQHGRTLLNDLHPSLVISTSDRRLGATVPAVARPSDGTYAVTFTAPNAERVFLTIKSGFMNTQLRLYPQPVVAAGGSRPVTTAGERGQILFVAKGCNTCHSNIDLSARPDNQSITAGPELGGRHLAREYVMQKIKGPASQIIPDLGLSDAEANAIAAFLSGDRAAATGR